jgi:hypothetical protein
MEATFKTRTLAEGETFSSDYLVPPELISGLETAFDEYVVAGIEHESFYSAVGVLRRSGAYSHMDEQSEGTAYAALLDGRDRAVQRLEEAQNQVFMVCDHLDVYLNKKRAALALDTLRLKPFTKALTVVLEGRWDRDPEGFIEKEERREFIADLASALAVFRAIAKADEADDKPERRAMRAEVDASFKSARNAQSRRKFQGLVRRERAGEGRRRDRE